MYFEDWERTPNDEIGPKASLEMAFSWGSRLIG